MSFITYRIIVLKRMLIMTKMLTARIICFVVGAFMFLLWYAPNIKNTIENIRDNGIILRNLIRNR